MTAYSEFRLRIDRGLSAGTYRVVATGPSGEALGRFKLPFSDMELENFVLKVGRTRRGKRRVESPEMELAKDFGGKLFTSLFDGDIKELFRSSFAEARTENRGLRITLSLTGAPELSQVRGSTCTTIRASCRSRHGHRSFATWTSRRPSGRCRSPCRCGSSESSRHRPTRSRSMSRPRRRNSVRRSRRSFSRAPWPSTGSRRRPCEPSSASCARPTITSSTTSGTAATTTTRTTASCSSRTIPAGPGGSPASSWARSCRTKSRSGWPSSTPVRGVEARWRTRSRAWRRA